MPIEMAGKGRIEKGKMRLNRSPLSPPTLDREWLPFHAAGSGGRVSRTGTDRTGRDGERPALPEVSGSTADLVTLVVLIRRLKECGMT